MSSQCWKVRFFVAGSVSGQLAVAKKPLSFWGGYDPATGQIIDPRHDLYGEKVAGKILAIPHGIGSSTTAAVLLDAYLRSTHPLALINVETEPILVIGALVIRKLYQEVIPVLSVTKRTYSQLRTGHMLTLDGTRNRIIFQ